MDDQFGKYLRLFGTIFFTVIGFLIALVLLFLGIKLAFGLMNYVPWLRYIYAIFIVLLPPILFITCYTIYFRRTGKHLNKPVKWISYILFTVALIMWILILFRDIMYFFEHVSTDIGSYYGYDMIFLIANVTLFFIIGVVQALTTEKEKDWMERNS